VNIKKKPLALSKESVRILNMRALKYVRGGATGDTCGTIQPDGGTTSPCEPVGTD